MAEVGKERLEVTGGGGEITITSPSSNEDPGHLVLQLGLFHPYASVDRFVRDAAETLQAKIATLPHFGVDTFKLDADTSVSAADLARMQAAAIFATVPPGKSFDVMGHSFGALPVRYNEVAGLPLEQTERHWNTSIYDAPLPGQLDELLGVEMNPRFIWEGLWSLVWNWGDIQFTDPATHNRYFFDRHDVNDQTLLPQETIPSILPTDPVTMLGYFWFMDLHPVTDSLLEEKGRLILNGGDKTMRLANPEAWKKIPRAAVTGEACDHSAIAGDSLKSCQQETLAAIKKLREAQPVPTADDLADLYNHWRLIDGSLGYSLRLARHAEPVHSLQALVSETAGLLLWYPYLGLATTFSAGVAGSVRPIFGAQGVVEAKLSAELLYLPASVSMGGRESYFWETTGSGRTDNGSRTEPFVEVAMTQAKIIELAGRVYLGDLSVTSQSQWDPVWFGIGEGDNLRFELALRGFFQ